MTTNKLNPVTPALRKTMRAMSDHQIIELVQVMMLDDHHVDDATATYVAAYDEAMKRPSCKFLIENQGATS